MRGGRRERGERGEGGRGRGAAPCFRVTRRVAGAGLGRRLPPASVTAESVRLAASQTGGDSGPAGPPHTPPAAGARAPPRTRPPGNHPPRCSAVCTLIRAGRLFSAHSLGSRWQNNAFPGRALRQDCWGGPDGGGGGEAGRAAQVIWAARSPPSTEEMGRVLMPSPRGVVKPEPRTRPFVGEGSCRCRHDLLSSPARG